MAAAKEELQIDIRAGEEQDVSFLFSVWLRNMKFSSDVGRAMRSTVFFQRYHQVVENILSSGAEVLIATPVGDRDVILGFLCFTRTAERPVIWTAYTKSAFRRLGVMARLLDAAGIDPNGCVFVTLTDTAKQLQKKWPEATYDPFTITMS